MLSPQFVPRQEESCRDMTSISPLVHIDIYIFNEFKLDSVCILASAGTQQPLPELITEGTGRALLPGVRRKPWVPGEESGQRQ